MICPNFLIFSVGFLAFSSLKLLTEFTDLFLFVCLGHSWPVLEEKLDGSELFVVQQHNMWVRF